MGTRRTGYRDKETGAVGVVTRDHGDEGLCKTTLKYGNC